jgi:hypothetical protein
MIMYTRMTLIGALVIALGGAPAIAGQCVSTLVGTPNPGSQENSLADVSGSSPSDVWAVGVYWSNINAVKSLIAHWDGTSWSMVASPKPAPGPVNSYGLNSVVAITPTNAWAVGTYRITNQSSIEPLVEHWNGTKWSIVAPPPGSTGATLESVTSVPHTQEIWVSGEQTWPTAWHWDGSIWWTGMVVPAPDARSAVLGSISAAASNDVWAAGTDQNPSHGPFGFVDHWNGSTWTRIAVRAAEQFSVFSAIDARTSSDVWVVGGESLTPYAFNHVLAEHWNGVRWHQESIPDPVGLLPNLTGVSALDNTNVWVSGSVLAGRRSTNTVIEHWTGTAWTVLNSTSGSAIKTAAFPFNVWSVGSSGGNAATLAVFSHC